MTRIGLVSDTHGFFDPSIWQYFQECDEIWHCGDFGSLDVIQTIQQKKTLRGVYGNIDGHEIRKEFPEYLIFQIEGINVFLKHIGGYPNRYAQGVKELIQEHQVKLFISGHSHILKVMHDPLLNLLHINPGAAGKEGFHKVRTIVRFTIHEQKISNVEVIELGPRTQKLSHE